MAKVFCLEDEIDKAPRNAIQTILKGHVLHLARSRDEAGDIWQGPYDLMLFDHDMRGFFDPSSYINTGYSFLYSILQSKGIVAQLKQGKVLLHSQNWEGRQNMSELLTKHNIPHEVHSFGPAYLTRLLSIEKELPR